MRSGKHGPRKISNLVGMEHCSTCNDVGWLEDGQGRVPCGKCMVGRVAKGVAHIKAKEQKEIP